MLSKLASLAIRPANGSVRGFRTLIKSGEVVPSRSEFAIAGFAGTVGLLDTARMHKERFGFNCHPHATLAQERPWFDLAHKSHLNRSWGHKLGDYSPEVQKLFLEAIPSINRTGLLKWGDLKQLYNYCRQKLESEFGVKLMDGKVDLRNITLGSKGFVIPFTGTLSNVKQIIMPPETVFYQLGAGVDRLPSIRGVSCLSVKQLYFMKPEDVPKKVVLFGAGLGSAWAVEHFPDTDFLILKRAEDKPLETSITGAWYERGNAYLININGSSPAHLMDVGDGTICVRSSGLSRAEFIAPAFAAMGSIREPKPLPDCIPLEQQVVQETIPAAELVTPRNLPPGSFMHSLLEFMKKTGNLDETTHNLATTTEKDFIGFIGQHAERNGLKISEEVKRNFSMEYCRQIRQLDHISNHEKVVGIVRSSYDKCEADPVKRELFERVTKSLADSYAHRIEANSMTKHFKDDLLAIRRDEVCKIEEKNELAFTDTLISES